MSKLDEVIDVFNQYHDIIDAETDDYNSLDRDYLAFVRDIRHCYTSYIIPKFQNYRFTYNLRFGREEGYFVSENNIINICTYRWYVGSELPDCSNLITPIMTPVLFEDIPTIKFLMLNHFTKCHPLVLFVVGNAEIMHLLLEYNLPTDKDIVLFIRYMIKEVELFRETKWHNIFESFVNHMSILNWVVNQIDTKVKPYYHAINNYGDMINCILHFYKYADIRTTELIPFAFAIRAINNSDDISRGVMLRSFANDVDKFKQLYKPEYLDKWPTAILRIIQHIDSLRYILSFPLSDELYKYFNRKYRYDYLHRDKFVCGLYEIYLKNLWMKVIFTETPMVMKMLMNESSVNHQQC